ncbi:MAG: glycogen synthase [Chloroflexi bacterium]|nr:glycogen synthase [Chloroflexota bacterium]MCI0580612.1 glycogen synthase [Chloroflexota bacterium]MCI0649724.1 glycogen synthase [Chloroflexota bacterium]MCI0727772.1 glycogen synthase [Chloroflexota bacterium]
MADPLKILYLSAEVAPFAKTGGLGDVGGSLPKALQALGHDVRVVMPAYRPIEESIYTGRYDLEVLPGNLNVLLGIGRLPTGVFEGRLPGSDVPVYFIAEGNLFNRPNIYGYPDDAYRFAFFSRAALDLTLALDWRPDVVHAHDWHTAPALTWLATAGQGYNWFQGIPSLFTIHNLAHQGRTTWDIFNYLGLTTHALAEEGYGEVNFMARGIYHATMINTVSPTYAREIMTPDGGAHLDGLLRYRSYDVHGILNGLDYDEWDPVTDTRIASRYNVKNLAGKRPNKRALQARAGLPRRDDVPLVAMISRLDWQKGLDITGHVVHLLLNGYAGEAQFIVLGTGAPEYENMFAQLASYHRDKMTAFLDYMPGLAPLIYAGSDIFLMPSRFEPCGLGQLIAMRYGTVPVVRATGGLADTVQDMVTGFTFSDYHTSAFWHALQRATFVHNLDKESWRKIQLNGMTADYSWQRSALGYQQLYEWAIARMRGW